MCLNTCYVLNSDTVVQAIVEISRRYHMFANGTQLRLDVYKMIVNCQCLGPLCKLNMIANKNVRVEITCSTVSISYLP